MNALIELVGWLAQSVKTSWAAIVAACAANPWKVSMIGLLVGGAVWWCVDRIRKKYDRRCRSPRCGRVFHQRRIPQMIPKSESGGVSEGEHHSHKSPWLHALHTVLRKVFRPTRWDYFIFWQCQVCDTTRLGLSELDKSFSWWKIAWRKAVHPAEFRIIPGLFNEHRILQYLPASMQQPSRKSTVHVSLRARGCGLTPRVLPDSRH